MLSIIGRRDWPNGVERNVAGRSAERGDESRWLGWLGVILGEKGSVTFDVRGNGATRQKASNVIGEAVTIKLEKVILVAYCKNHGTSERRRWHLFSSVMASQFVDEFHECPLIYLSFAQVMDFKGSTKLWPYVSFASWLMDGFALQ